MDLPENVLRERLRKFDCRVNRFSPKTPDGFVTASVLIPLFLSNGIWRVMLTVRSKQMRSHPGLVAFPGGHEDDDDPDIIHTALREAEEEIGILPENVNIVGVLTPMFVRPNKMVHLIVGIVIKSFEPKINTEEVAKVFDLPLERFLRDDYYNAIITVGKRPYPTYTFKDDIDGETIITWGFTSVVCMMLALVLFDSDKTLSVYHSGNVTKSNAFGIEAFQDNLRYFTESLQKSKM